MSTKLIRCALALVAAACLFPPEPLRAQPSLVGIPMHDTQFITRFSPDGTQIAGWGDPEFIPRRDAFYFDITSGLLRRRSNFPTLPTENFQPSVVIDSGFVYGSIGLRVGRKLAVRWNPINGQYNYSEPASLLPDDSVFLTDVSADGLVASGFVNAPGNGSPIAPVRYTFASAVPGPGDTFTLLAVPAPTSAEALFLRQRGAGVFDIWGHSLTPPAALLWPLNSTGGPLQTPLPPSPVPQFIGPLSAVSQDGSVLLDTRRKIINGVAIDLLPPAGFQDVEATDMSADGRVVIGLVKPSSGSADPLHRRVVLWRDGGQPEDLIGLLAPLGLDLANVNPEVNIARIPRVSGDGSTVAAILMRPIEPGEASILGTPFVAVVPPKNDGCVNPRPVSFGVYRDSLRGATASLSSNVCFSDANAPDVWYAFTPSANEIVRLDTCGSDFDTTITVYRGTAASCGTNFAPVVCTNDSNTTFCPQNTATSVVDFSAQIGSVYYIRLAGNFGQRGNAVLTITPPARPVNDTCGGALPLDAGFSREVNTSNATTDSRPGCPGSPLPFFDVWYRTVAPDTGRMTFSTCGSQGNFVVAVYGEDACGNPAAAPIDCSGTVGCSGPGGIVTVSATRNQVFYLRVGGAFGAQGPGGRVSALYSCDSNQLLEYNLAVLAAQPIFHHRFEEPGITTAADAVRSDPFSCGNYPGRYFSTFKVPGVLGNAVVFNFFDPVAGVRQIFAPANLGDASLEAWIKTTNPFAGDILQSRGAEPEFGLALTLGAQNEGELAFTNEGPDGFSFGARTQTNVADGRWHHVVGTRRNIIPGLGTIYQYLLWVDGELVASSSTFDSRSQVGTSADGPWVIGTRNINPGAFNIFNGGAIDEVAVYPSAQSGQQIGDRFLLATGGCVPLISNRRLIGPTTFVNPDVPLAISMDARSTRPITYRWEARFRDGTSEVLADGARADGSTISGATTNALVVQGTSFPFWESARLTGRAMTDCGEQVVTTTLDLPGACLCQVDVNCDVNLDADDLGDFINCYFAVPPCGNADFNGDGSTDADDLGDFINAYFAGCP